LNRRGKVACNNLSKTEEALRGIFLDIHRSNESTIHPANGLLIQALQLSDNTDLMMSVHYTNDDYSHMLDSWVSKLDEDAKMIRPGEKGGKDIFLLNNIYHMLQMMHRPGATFANSELVNRLISMIQQYTKSYIDECWVPLKHTLHLNLDEFTAEFLATCDNQRTWKVTAELRYKLREGIVDLIVPAYEAYLSAQQANRSRLSVSGVLCSSEQVIEGNKKPKKHTGKELEEEIKVLFEG
jgi:hypothetical protein